MGFILRGYIFIFYCIVGLIPILIRTGNAQIPFLGRCPDRTTVANFEASKYLGTWYEYEKYPFIFELGGKCVTATYGIYQNSTISVFNRQIDFLTKQERTINGKAEIVGSGKLMVRFPSVPINIASPYWVLGTDYNSYAVVSSCNDFILAHTEVVWILTRSRLPDLSTILKAYAVLQKQGITSLFMMKTDQYNCDIYFRNYEIKKIE